MKYIRIVIVLLLLGINSIPLLCQHHKTGLGIMIGEPTGINLKSWIGSKSAIDVGLAWSFTHDASMHIHADYLLHSFNLFDDAENLALYYGIGGRIKVGDEKARIGFRMVGGLDYMFDRAPFDIFLEIAPILDLAPATEMNGNVGIGARFFF
jgi:hypothetical protein